jgi:hypothetical protein
MAFTEVVDDRRLVEGLAGVSVRLGTSTLRSFVLVLARPLGGMKMKGSVSSGSELLLGSSGTERIVGRPFTTSAVGLGGEMKLPLSSST